MDGLVFLLLKVYLLLEVLDAVCGFDDCPAPAPCRCGSMNDVIDCTGDGFHAVPTFQKSSKLWDVYLGSNNLLSLPSAAFRNIKVQYLQLDNNQITSIAPDAFHGSENVLRSIHLSNNKLTSLPPALGQLKNLTYLDIKGNPIPNQFLSPDVLLNISNTLNAFHFGSPEMTSWPSVLQSLKLFELGIHNLPLEYLPESAFTGSLKNLSWLYIISTNLRRLPTSLNQAKGMYFMSLDSNEYLTSEGVSMESFQGLSKINWFQIQNEEFDTVPNIFTELTELEQLDILSTPIGDFESDLIAKPSKIKILTLNDTRISNVPSAVTQMKSMVVLALNFNNITNIADNDFDGFSNLTFLSVSNCPLRNVSLNALKSMTSLKYLAFDSTELTTIPRAIENIKFDIISLFNNPTVCSCESLGWMKHWSQSQQIGINGHCHNLGDSDLADYVRKEVPKCET